MWWNRRCRQTLVLALACAACPGSVLLAQSGTEAPGEELTLDQARAIALERSPVLRARRAELAEARARLLTARTYPFNPEIALEAAQRRGPGDKVTDRGGSLSQEIELAGQRGKRIAVGRADLAVAEAQFTREWALLAAQVELVFAEVVRARELLDLEETDADLAREFAATARRRLEAGAASQIEVNFAAAALGRAERRLEGARATLAEGRSLLAEVTNLDMAAPPVAAGELPDPGGDLPPLAELLAGALERRADLAAFRRAAEAAHARLRLATAERNPNLNLAGFYAEEEGIDTLRGASMALSLPLFNRNQGAVAEARASIERSQAEAEGVRLAVQRETASAYAGYRAAQVSAARLREQVLGTLEENLDLLQRSFAAGKIGASELLVFRRELVDSRRELIEALADAWRLRVTLDLAVGRIPPPPDSDFHRSERQP